MIDTCLASPMPDGPQIVAPSVPEHGLRTVHVDHDGHRETFAVGFLGDDHGWLFGRLTDMDAPRFVVRSFPPLPIVFPDVFGMHRHDLVMACYRRLCEELGVEA